MNETRNFKDVDGDFIQACGDYGHITLRTFGAPRLTTEQARQFADELIKLANEIESTQ